jgi:Glucosamine 6-phosphate synthetase, contains amidotransferase and phosphosugar isomerase domains
MYVGSDAIALAPMTDRIPYLEEGDWAVITRAGATIHDAEGRLANREMRQIRLESAAANKAGYKHYMAKEIAEQPGVIGNALRHYIDSDAGRAVMPDALDFTHIDRLVMVACAFFFYVRPTDEHR